MFAPSAATHAAAAAAVDGSGSGNHAHVDGKCTSWVDEALDAAGPEYADAPRPGSCCDKDAKEAKEAARIRRIVSAADPAARAAAMRAASDPANVLATMMMPPPPSIDEDEDSDDLLTDSDDDDDDDTRMMPTLDPVLLEIQERRIREMKAAAARAAADAAKASYTSAKEIDLPKIIADAPSRVVVHLPLDGSDESARIDEVLDTLAPGFARTRFVRVRGEGGSLHSSPLLATLGASALPALVCFRRGRVKQWTAGLDDFGGTEGFDEDRVVRWLATAGDALPGHPMAPLDKKVSPEGGHMYSSDDDDDHRDGRGHGHGHGRGRERGRGRGGGSSEEEDEDDGGGAGVGVGAAAGEPCAQCGRRYPHQHFRALRHGDGGGRRGSDDDDDDD